ncbi:hypothetical protein FA95DRAFT_105027 [Auriscalpium vulgare]|uniref:Uncharacterized protein n=1 Tax=Auriscalpium vulgare TaxID=40419 RepID=A0ACB8RP35_9AGAM|nr:hypothetical protein FA95DRAFT_105027 [Auriscalpium vulgare]
MAQQHEPQLLAKLLSDAKDYHKNLTVFLDTYAQHSLLSLSAYAATSPAPIGRAVIAVAGSLAGADDALRKYAGSGKSWRAEMRAMQSLEEEIASELANREALATRMSDLSGNQDNTRSVALNSFVSSAKADAAQAELKASDHIIAAKKGRLQTLRTETLRSCLEKRCKALMECGRTFEEVGKVGLRVLEGLDSVESDEDEDGEDAPHSARTLPTVPSAPMFETFSRARTQSSVLPPPSYSAPAAQYTLAQRLTEKPPPRPSPPLPHRSPSPMAAPQPTYAPQRVETPYPRLGSPNPQRQPIYTPQRVETPYPRQSSPYAQRQRTPSLHYYGAAPTPYDPSEDNSPVGPDAGFVRFAPAQAPSDLPRPSPPPQQDMRIGAYIPPARAVSPYSGGYPGMLSPPRGLLPRDLDDASDSPGYAMQPFSLPPMPASSNRAPYPSDRPSSPWGMAVPTSPDLPLFPPLPPLPPASAASERERGVRAFFRELAGSVKSKLGRRGLAEAPEAANSFGVMAGPAPYPMSSPRSRRGSTGSIGRTIMSTGLSTTAYTSYTAYTSNTQQSYNQRTNYYMGYAEV